MKTKLMNLKNVPKWLDLEISRSVAGYSVALGRVRNEKAESFSAIGSGTLIVRDGKYGILTAHHCLHNDENPDVLLGKHSGDKLILLLTRGRTVIVEPQEVYERVLAVPKSEEYGPDLTFIEISPGPRLSSIQAVGSFWNLNEDRRDQAQEFVHPGICIVNSGYPGVDYVTEVSGYTIHHSVKHMAFIGALTEGEISIRDGWDYIESSTNRGVIDALPETFKGVSGGGIWAVRLHVSNSDEWSVYKECMVGVTFYQSPEVDLRRKLQGHFVDSIYHTAWNQTGEHDAVPTNPDPP